MACRACGPRPEYRDRMHVAVSHSWELAGASFTQVFWEGAEKLAYINASYLVAPTHCYATLYYLCRPRLVSVSTTRTAATTLQQYEYSSRVHPCSCADALRSFSVCGWSMRRAYSYHTFEKRKICVALVLRVRSRGTQPVLFATFTRQQQQHSYNMIVRSILI